MAAMCLVTLSSLAAAAAAEERATRDQSLSLRVDAFPLKDIVYRQENCAPFNVIEGAYLNVKGETEIGENYALSPFGDVITSYYNARNDNTGTATSTIVFRFGDDKDNACIIGSSSVALQPNEILKDASRFKYHITVYLDPKPGQLFNTGDDAFSSNTSLGMIRMGDGSYSVIFQKTAQNMGQVVLKDAGYASLLAGAVYNEPR